MIDIGDIRVAFVITVSLYYLTVYVRALELLYIRVYDSELSCFEVQRSVSSTSGHEPVPHQPETYSRVSKCVRLRWFAIEEAEVCARRRIKSREPTANTHRHTHIYTHTHRTHRETFRPTNDVFAFQTTSPHITLKRVYRGRVSLSRDPSVG